MSILGTKLKTTEEVVKSFTKEFETIVSAQQKEIDKASVELETVKLRLDAASLERDAASKMISKFSDFFGSNEGASVD